ncbi:hypothetical protein [Victivallis sp. Marseille-Q1083]|uniref:hypothetical protein n=1 Tax=Victivallis sp. Marseille-Q1083 TaxID=2717288 RepID=UPI00158E27CB|nr:hypothetical protein [Victivallis sp. Marseille-Q1083]
MLHAAGVNSHITRFAIRTDILYRTGRNETAERNLPSSDFLSGINPVIHGRIRVGLDDVTVFTGSLHIRAEIITDVRSPLRNKSGGGSAGFHPELASRQNIRLPNRTAGFDDQRTIRY